MSNAVTVYEVGPRDGLQNEPGGVSTRDKIAFIDRLSRSGLPAIEVTALVDPARVPSMADAEAVLAGISRLPGTRYSALVPNRRGLERAARAGLREIAVFAAASETFSRRNVNASIDESIARYREVATEAESGAMRVRAYLSTAFGCPYEGLVPVARVVELAGRLLDLGAFEVAVSDTIGIAHPAQVRDLLDRMAEHAPLERLALHFHDTRGMAAANVLAAVERGVRTFDASAGGLGGCPFAPGATGNLATEDLLYLLAGLGCTTGVDLDIVAEASLDLEEALGRPLPSRALRAWAAGRRPSSLPGSAG